MNNFFDLRIDMQSILMAIGMIGTTFLWIFERKKAKKLEAKAAKAEEELAQTKRRGHAPYLAPSDAVVSGIYTGFNEGCMMVLPLDSGNVLSVERDEVAEEMSAEEHVVFLVENLGESARSCTVMLDGKEIEFCREPDLEQANGLQYLVYAFDPKMRGQEQRLTISFETRNGVQDTHVYLTRHGCRVLKRIDPPLPNNKGD